jgi:hypothetical protein
LGRGAGENALVEDHYGKTGRPQMLCVFEIENLYVLQDFSCLLLEYIYNKRDKEKRCLI